MVQQVSKCDLHCDDYKRMIDETERDKSGFGHTEKKVNSKL